jgi:asparagine synthetase B (glutamine-hydrolysing)
MYAVILHDLAADPPTAKILRDHIGIKPLFMAKSPKGIHLASEVKAFRDLTCGSTREIKPGRLHTLIHRNGEWFEASEEDVRPQLLADLDKVPNLTAASLRSVISEAVASQWPDENLPVAVLCSGGIDSSIVTQELALQIASHRSAKALEASAGGPASDSAPTRRPDRHGTHR